MGRPATRALRYAILGQLQPAGFPYWRADREHDVGGAEFARQAAQLCGLADEARNLRRDGARGIEQAAARIVAREAALARRTALDLQRLEDLQARYAARRASALKRKWFVIGRVVEAAMREDATLRAAVFALLSGARLRKDERLVLGLDAM